MGTAIEVKNLSRRHRSVTALDDVTLSFEANTIHGLLGRNGAGKTSLMSIIAGQDWPSEGEVRVFGQRPHENESVLQRMCFVREDQKYMNDAKPGHAFTAAALAYPNWDEGLAQRLIEDFRLPMKTKINKLSRGQRSAVAVIIGLACRAEITFFDEPYIGLDAAARQLFYDRLLEDYAENPRTVVVSSHLIDEIAPLIEHVVLLDRGRVLLDESAEQLRDRAVTLIGRWDHVRAVIGEREVLRQEELGRMVRVTVLGGLDEDELARARELDLDTAPVSLQQLVVHLSARQGATLETAKEA
ncbi:ABC transporter ATP-binding protein [Sediminivirga luteola]|uniref:ABC transporter ATP-binding protein n=1 Tax=Sediminivirga luteola TaxID=1774748 RepID=UPI001F5800FD|nr:ABC transporter ATP-binding protein [Sediminivirga luteola]MCI2264448.1 ABC transporter ATP-binding protein [Sediminivirga luteola]